MVSSSEVSIYYSGASSFGQFQNNPLKSLGGYRSSVKFFNGKEDNLFDEVGIKEASEGSENYRCLFFKNEHSTDEVLNLSLWISGKQDFEEISFGVSQAATDQDAVQSLQSQDEIPYNIDFNEAYVEGDKVELITSLEAGRNIAIWFCRKINSTEERQKSDTLLLNFDWS